ncbi:MAG: ribonuclease [Bacteroidota bacterium]|nr:ribonuclease [Bacteroidota bacterium]
MKVISSKMLPDDTFERPFWEKGKLAAGIDEAGRGCLAGPVVAAAIILPIGLLNECEINDSKLLSPAKRFEIAAALKVKALAYSVCFVDNERIDKINILQATFEAMLGAVRQLETRPEHLLIDGNRFPGCEIPHTVIIDGDALCLSIAAASILAKTERDLWMQNIADIQYPGFGFAKHKGYGTKKHYEAIERSGITPIHRLSFLKKITESVLF